MGMILSATYLQPSHQIVAVGSYRTEGPCRKHSVWAGKAHAAPTQLLELSCVGTTHPPVSAHQACARTVNWCKFRWEGGGEGMQDLEAIICSAIEVTPRRDSVMPRHTGGVFLRTAP